MEGLKDLLARKTVNLFSYVTLKTASRVLNFAVAQLETAINSLLESVTNNMKDDTTNSVFLCIDL